MTLKDYIFKNLSQVSIFAKYLNLNESDIQDSINFKNHKIKSPLRRDSDNSLSFRYYGDRLICRDFGNVEWSGDIFDIVGKVINKNSRNSNEFIEICKHIINNVNITNSVKITQNKDNTDDPVKIEIRSRNFSTKDMRYFWQFFIPNQSILDNYICVNSFSINGYKSNYMYSSDDPCYAYINNPGCYKLYFPFRKKNEIRFISNNKCPIELLDKIVKKDHTILIKAFKDKQLMDHVCRILDINNTQFIPLASESARLDNTLVSYLRSKTNKQIHTMLDLDACGIDSGMFYNREYGFNNIVIGEDKSTKDPTDLARKIKLEKFVERFYNIYKNL